MSPTVVSLVTPHLLRVVDFANQAEMGVNVDWHLRDVVSRTMGELRGLWNAPELMSAYVRGLEDAAGQAVKTRTAYSRALQAAAVAARDSWRD